MIHRLNFEQVHINFMPTLEIEKAEGFRVATKLGRETAQQKMCENWVLSESRHDKRESCGREKRR